MIKKSISLALVFFLLFPLTAFASIDISVFEDNDIYQVEIDDFDDTGEISFVPTDENEDAPSNYILGTTDEDGSLLGNFDIKLLSEDSLAVIRLTLLYTGDDWIFVDDCIIKTKKHRYTFSVDRDTDYSDGKIYECITNEEGDAYWNQVVMDMYGYWTNKATGTYLNIKY